MKKYDRTTWVFSIVTIVALIGLSVTGIYFSEIKERQRSLSSYSVQSDGFYVAYSLLNHLFPGKVYRDSSSLTHLLEKPGCILITARSQWASRDRAMALRWMKDGGVLILLSPLTEDQGELSPARRASPTPEWPGLHDLPAYHIPTSRVLKLKQADQQLYSSKYGADVAVRPWGRGRRIVFSNLMINGSLVDHPEGAAILGKLVAVYLKDRRMVLWDEESLLLSSAQNSQQKKDIGRVSVEHRFTWIGLAIFFQTLLTAMLYAMTRGKRFGQPVALDNRTELTLRDYIRSLTGFYYRAGARTIVIEELYTDLRRRLVRIAGVNHSVSNELLAEAIHQLIHIDSNFVRNVLNEAKNALSSGVINERQLHRLGRQMHQIRREIEKYGIHY